MPQGRPKARTANDPSLRATDNDRTEAAGVLDKAYGDGQLDSTEHRDRLTRALRAKTLAELHSLVADLQTEVTMRQAKRSINSSRTANRAGSGLLIGVVVVAVILLIAAFFGIRAIISGVGGKDPLRHGENGYLTLDGAAELFSAVHDEIGEVDEMVVYPAYAVIDHPDPDESRREISTRYDGSFTRSTTGTRDHSATFDPESIDPRIIAGLVLGVRESVGVPDADRIYAIIEGPDGGARELPEGMPAPEPVTISIYAYNEFSQGGYIKADRHGTILSAYPAQK